MLKKTITYTDYEGVQRTEDHYFNLSKAEAIEMQVGEVGGFDAMIKRIVAAEDNKKIVEIFKELILKAYGQKSPDGKRFIKSKELSEAFSQTEAYVELYIELATVTEAAVAFVKGIMPPEGAIQLKDHKPSAE